MFGEYIEHQLPRRDSIVAGIDVETPTMAVFLTASTSLTSSVTGLTTLESSSPSTGQPTSQPTFTIISSKTLTTSKQTITSTLLITSTSSINKPSPTTTSQSPPPTPPPPPPPPPQPQQPQPQQPQPQPQQPQPQQPQPQPTLSPSSSPTIPPPPPPPPSFTENAPQQTSDIPAEEDVVAEPVYKSSYNGPNLIPEQIPTSVLPAEVTPTAFKDLPLSIVSPSTTVPISMPLLVATSSTPAVVLISPSSTYPSRIFPSNPPTASETALPKMAGMTAGGKVSAIFGVVLFLGAACLMYQLYYKKKRQAEKARQLRDNEKQDFGSPSVASKVGPGISSQRNSYLKSTVGLSFNSASEKNSPQESQRANPFGKHAEVLVDSINASGPNVIEKVGSEQTFLTRGTSKKGSSAPRSATGDLMANTNNYGETEQVSTGPTSPQEINNHGATQPTSRPVSAVYRVQLDFTPSMNDELELRSGQLIRVLHEFDDGWAMCIRLDCSEQGVCPRTCLSTRPLKPRSPSTSSSGRPVAQITQGYYNGQNPKEFEPLPMLPVAQSGPAQRTPPILIAGCNPNSNPIILSKNNVNSSQQAMEHCDQLPTTLPLKNAARYVSLTLQKPNGSISHSIPELSGSPAPDDDYFSFSKPPVETVSTDNMAAQLPSPTSINMCGNIGIPAHYLSEKPSNQKAVPGQAL